MSKQRGFIPLIAIIIFLALASVGTITYIKFNPGILPFNTALDSDKPTPSPFVSPTASASATVAPTPSPVVKVSTVPLIDCLGPDKKHTMQTQANCDALNKLWASPSPSPLPSAAASTTSSSSSSDCSVGQISVSISASNGSVVGDAVVEISPKSSSCGSFSSNKILSQGSSSVTFTGVPPGSYNLRVMYHGNYFSDSADLGSNGNTSKTVSVSN